MKLKVTILFLLGNFCQLSTLAIAQVLLRDNYLPFMGDSIIIFQQPYVEIVDSGFNCIWDFSFLIEETPVNVNYYTNTSLGDNVIGEHLASEHIYYREKSDSVYVIGRESSVHKITYLIPEPVIKFPFSFGDSICQSFLFKEEWGDIHSCTTSGDVYIKADAIGKLILPSDTLDSIVRVSTREDYKTINTDSISLIKYSRKWYSSLSTRPVIETTKVINNDSISIAYTLYYPIQNISSQKSKHVQNLSTSDNNESVNVVDVSYFPNPVITELCVCYTLYTTIKDISFSLYSANGICMYSKHFSDQEAGIYYFKLHMSAMPLGVYTLCVDTDDIKLRKEIIKR